MKKSLIAIIILTASLLGCKKEEEVQPFVCPEVVVSVPATEVTNLRTYLQTNNITATEDARGFFYTVETSGAGPKPTACSLVAVDYIGTLTTGEEFDRGTNAQFYLSGLITGWRLALPLVPAGSTVTLYLPPSLGYGSQANGKIPANSNLIFKINLKQVYQ